jgi:hypothetical protein
VKRISGIFLISIYMFTFAGFDNLLKAPVLLSHFKEHRQLDANISFWTFIKIHYVGPIIVDDDFQRDKQLPFRDAAFCMVAVNYACECPQTQIEIGEPDQATTEFSDHYVFNKPIRAPYEIFQPPRRA